MIINENKIVYYYWNANVHRFQQGKMLSMRDVIQWVIMQAIGEYSQWQILRWKPLKLPWYDLFLVSYKSPNFNLISYTPYVVKNNCRKALRILYQKYMFLYSIRSGIARIRLSYIMFVPLTILTSFWTISCRHVVNLFIKFLILSGSWNNNKKSNKLGMTPNVVTMTTESC